MNKKRLIGLIIFLCMFGVLFCEDAVFASGEYAWFGTGGGTISYNGDWTGYPCNADPEYFSERWRIDCAGVSWAEYKAVGPASSSGTTFPSIRGVGVNNATIPQVCSEERNGKRGYFYHLGINLLGGHLENDYGNYDNEIHVGKYGWESNNYNGHWATLNWKYVANNDWPYNTEIRTKCGNYTCGDQYVNNIDNAYKFERFLSVREALELYNEARVADGLERRDSFEAGLWGFCYWGPASYFGSSAGSITDANGEIIVDEVTTGVVAMGSETVVEAEPVNVSDLVNLNFKHNVYSAESNKEGWWRVSEVWFNAEKSTGKFEDVIIDEGVAANNQANSGKVKFGKGKEGDYYIPDGDPLSNPIVVATLPIKVEAGGTYVFCQDLKIAASEESLAEAKVTSEACVSVKVDTNYYGLSAAYAQSNMGLSDSTSTEIEIMDAKVTASPDATVKINFGEGLSNKAQTVTMVFSHDIYADSEGGEVYWGVRRDSGMSLDTSYFPDSPMHFTSPMEDGYYVNSSGMSGNYCDTNPYSEVCLNYFYILNVCDANGWDMRQCSYMTNIDDLSREIQQMSSGSSGKFVIKDTTRVTIYPTQSSATYRYCERLYLAEKSKAAAEGNSRFTTQACVKIEVTYSKDGIGDSDRTYVKSRIKNPRLSDDFKGIENEPNEQEGNVVYAKPGDTILWQDEYSPGAQRLSNQPVLTLNGATVGSHGAHSCGGGSAHTYKAMGEAGNWDNMVSIEADYPLFETPDFGEWNRGEFHLKRESPVREHFICNSVGNLENAEAEIKEKCVEVDDNNQKSPVVDVGKDYYDMIQTEGNTPQTASYSTEGESFSAECKRTCGGVNNRHTCWITTGPFYHSNYIIHGKYTSATVTEGVDQLKSKTFLKVPFNYENTLGFEISRETPPGEVSPVYPGETVQVVHPYVTVNPKKNDLVEDTYATEVRDAKVVLIAYVSGDNQGVSSWDVKSTEDNLCGFVADKVVYDVNIFCEEVNRNTTTTLEVKNDGLLEQQTKDGVTYYDTILGTNFSGTYNVFDAKAGDWFCMTLGVYPATSGDDDNLKSSGSESWRLYTPECIQIAKKPSFQVWGSGLYSAAEGTSITTNVSEKNNLFKISSHRYAPRDGSVTIFGSWVEENVMTIGSTQWLTSGASLGKNGSVTKGGYGGGGVTSIETVFCKSLIPLSFANYGYGGFSSFICPNNQASGYAGVDATAFDPTKTNVGALAEYWNDGDLPFEEYPEAIDLGGAEIGNSILSATSKDIRSIKTEGDITIGESRLTANQTRIVKAENVTISGNIYYDTSTHETLNDLSKVVIHASSNINILCGVNRIDAVLLAAGTVNTCSDAGDIDDESRSNQLVVNGTIITNEMKLERTYGNSMGISDGGYVSDDVEGGSHAKHTVPGSETPAEIINYDMSLLIWGASMAGAGESNTLTMTYQYELAPRY